MASTKEVTTNLEVPLSLGRYRIFDAENRDIKDNIVTAERVVKVHLNRFGKYLCDHPGNSPSGAWKEIISPGSGACSPANSVNRSLGIVCTLAGVSFTKRICCWNRNLSVISCL
ncbi:MAG: hypothetical protein CM15mP120_28140 [Pseudomonadota bacterium]|nr:MAG: hypothetical protein CM15mP120_28140 [Pseudomonadota bacterium]